MSIFDTNTLLLLHCDDFNDSCNNYTITNNSVTISDEGKFGNCFSINQSYITFNKSIELNCNTGFTIDFWINPSRFDAQYQYHLSSGLNFVSYDKNKVYCSICGINKDAFYANEPLLLNEFTHIAIVGENNVIKIFINGVLKASKDAINETQTFDTNNKFFMYQSGATAHNPVCKIDEFRISNVARWQTDFEVPVNEYEIVTLEKLSNESSLIDVNERNEILLNGLGILKNNLKNNLISKDVSALDSDSFSTLINKINDIPTGKKWASGIFGENASGRLFTVSNLAFEPSVVICIYKKQNYTQYVGANVYTPILEFKGYRNNSNYSAMPSSAITIESNGFTVSLDMTISAEFDHVWYAFE